MPRLFAALAVLLPAAALAQFSQLTVTVDDEPETFTFSGAQCANSARVAWQATPSAQVCTDLRVFATAANTCPSKATADDLSIRVVPATEIATNTSATFRLGDLPGFSTAADAGVACGQPGSRSWLLCAYYEQMQPSTITVGCNETNNTKVSKSVTLRYDATPPGAPTLTDVVALGGALRATATTDGETALVRYGVRLASEPDSAYAFRWEAVPEGNTAAERLEGLQNGVSYQVVAVAYDKAGNASGESNMLEGMPLETRGFWQTYKDAGGTEQGGCRAAGGGVLAGLGALSIWRLRRRRS